MNINSGKVRIVLTIILLICVVYLPRPAFSQDTIQDLIVNGGFEGGFQEDFGIGYGWGAFSNGNAIAGWSFDDWSAVVVDGQYAQRLEIRDALDLNRYAGIYQTVSVVPGEQYKLTIEGLIRSTEGDVSLSDYGYRMQYAIDYEGDIAWELLPETAWQEMPWDEQALSEAPDSSYRHDIFETTITAEGDTLTLFIRAWKKWLNNGSGVYNLDRISIVGPVPEGFQSPIAQEANTAERSPELQVAAADDSEQSNTADNASEFSTQTTEVSIVETEPETIAEPAPETATEAEIDPQLAETSVEVAPQDEAQTQDTTIAQAQIQAPAEVINPSNAAQTAQLPVSGQGDDRFNYVLPIGVFLLLILVIAAALSMTKEQHQSLE